MGILENGCGHFQRLRLRLFFLLLNSRKRTPLRKSFCIFVSCFYQSILHIAVRHNDFTAITIPYFNVCFVVIHVRLHFETPLTCMCHCDWNYNVVSTILGTLSNEDGNANDDGSEKSLISFVLYFFVQVIWVLFRCFKFCE